MKSEVLDEQRAKTITASKREEASVSEDPEGSHRSGYQYIIGEAMCAEAESAAMQIGVDAGTKSTPKHSYSQTLEVST